MSFIDGSDKWNWVEKQFARTSIHYIFCSIFIGMILFCVFVVFSFNVKHFNFYENYDYLFEASLMCILIIYELSGIVYLLRSIRETFMKFQFEESAGDKYIRHDPYILLKYKLTKSRLYYIVIFLIIIPLLIIDVSDYVNPNKFFFYRMDKSPWNLGLDIYNYGLTYFINFLLGVIIWIIINILVIIYDIKNKEFKCMIKVSITNIDQMGGLSPLKNLILKIVIYYFVCIALAVASYINPFGLIYYQNIFYAFLLLLGVVLFIYGFWSIRGILKGKVERESRIVSSLCDSKYNKAIDMLSKEERNDEEMKQLSDDLDLLYKYNEKLSDINWRIYNLRSVFVFIASLIIPNIVAIIKYSDSLKQIYPFLENLYLNFKLF